jgi:hypothetical protein
MISARVAPSSPLSIVRTIAALLDALCSGL